MEKSTYLFGKHKGTLDYLCQVYNLEIRDVIEYINYHECSYEEAFMALIPQYTLYTYKGKSLTLEEWSKLVEIPAKVLLLRLEKYKMSISAAFSSPIKSSCR